LSKLSKKSNISNEVLQTNLNYFNKNIIKTHYTNNVFLKNKEYLKIKKSSITEKEMLNLQMTKLDKFKVVCFFINIYLT
jgi:hypothetical protein